MASALSNTHATIFTQLPKSIRKVWAAKPVYPKSGTLLSCASNKHEFSLIETVEILVTFVDLPECDLITFTDSDDLNDDKIKAWQLGKSQWQKLDEAITKGVETLTNAAIAAAAERSMMSVDVLKHNLTQYRRQSNSAARSAQEPIDTEGSVLDQSKIAPINNLSGYAQTVVPNDSTSQVATHSSYSKSSTPRSTRVRTSKHSKHHREISRGILGLSINKH